MRYFLILFSLSFCLLLNAQSASSVSTKCKLKYDLKKDSLIDNYGDIVSQYSFVLSNELTSKNFLDINNDESVASVSNSFSIDFSKQIDLYSSNNFYCSSDVTSREMNGKYGFFFNYKNSKNYSYFIIYPDNGRVVVGEIVDNVSLNYFDQYYSLGVNGLTYSIKQRLLRNPVRGGQRYEMYKSYPEKSYTNKIQISRYNGDDGQMFYFFVNGFLITKLDGNKFSDMRYQANYIVPVSSMAVLFEESTLNICYNQTQNNYEMNDKRIDSGKSSLNGLLNNLLELKDSCYYTSAGGKFFKCNGNYYFSINTYDPHSVIETSVKDSIYKVIKDRRFFSPLNIYLDVKSDVVSELPPNKLSAAEDSYNENRSKVFQQYDPLIKIIDGFRNSIYERLNDRYNKYKGYSLYANICKGGEIKDFITYISDGDISDDKIKKWNSNLMTYKSRRLLGLYLPYNQIFNFLNKKIEKFYSGDYFLETRATKNISSVQVCHSKNHNSVKYQSFSNKLFFSLDSNYYITKHKKGVNAAMADSLMMTIIIKSDGGIQDVLPEIKTYFNDKECSTSLINSTPLDNLTSIPSYVSCYENYFKVWSYKEFSRACINYVGTEFKRKYSVTIPNGSDNFMTEYKTLNRRNKDIYKGFYIRFCEDLRVFKFLLDDNDANSFSCQILNSLLNYAILYSDGHYSHTTGVQPSKNINFINGMGIYIFKGDFRYLPVPHLFDCANFPPNNVVNSLDFVSRAKAIKPTFPEVSLYKALFTEFNSYQKQEDQCTVSDVCFQCEDLAQACKFSSELPDIYSAELNDWYNIYCVKCPLCFYNVCGGSSKSLKTGSRGGRYYINGSGNKTYIK